MSNRAGQGGWTGSSAGQPAGGSLKIAAAIAERQSGDSLLRFLSRLAAFGLAAGRDPLLKSTKPGT